MFSHQKIPKSITWNDDGTGWLQGNSISYTIFRREKWLKNKIDEMITKFVQNPEWWDVEKRCKKHKIPMKYDQYSDHAWPMFETSQLSQFSDSINDQLDVVLPHLARSDQTESVTDFQFLFNLTTKRNWKSGCAICLTDKIMGTTCGCGHTEIAVFRPCGHSVCANPCFNEFIKAKGQTLKPKILKIDGTEFIMMDMAGTTMDIAAAGKFECPYCKATVEKVIRAEDTYCDDSFKSVIDSIFKEVTKGVESLFVEEE